MALSGISVADVCVDEFINLQKHHRHRYIIYKIENKNLVVIDKIEEKCNKDKNLDAPRQFEKFACELMKHNGAYAVYDAEYTTAQGVKREKVIFFLWCPGTGTICTRMLYSSTKDTIKKKFNGLHAEIQANDADDLKWESIVEKLERFKQ